jgi:hypothetical protein
VEAGVHEGRLELVRCHGDAGEVECVLDLGRRLGDAIGDADAQEFEGGVLEGARAPVVLGRA